MFSWLVLAKDLLTPLAVVAAGLILRSLKNPTDAERAALLSRIANDCAELVLSKWPTAPAAQLLVALIAAISGAAGLPTKNAAAIKRVAVAALKAKGVTLPPELL